MIISVIITVEKESHLNYYPSRQELWTYLKHHKLRVLVDFLTKKFAHLYDDYARTHDGFSKLLMDWHSICGQIACENLEKDKTSLLWQYINDGYKSPISQEDRSALISSIGAACYTFFQRQVSLFNKHWASMHLTFRSHLQASIVVTPDDDISLYRLWGFSLFASIRFRRQALTKFRKRYTPSSRKPFLCQVQVY